MCNTCGCKDAESFEAYAHQGLTKLYGISGGVKIQSTVQRIIADINEGQGFADDEYYYLTEDERDEAYEEMEFDAESFEAEEWRERFFKNPQVLTVGGKDIALIDEYTTKDGGFRGIEIMYPIEGGSGTDGWYGPSTNIMFKNEKLDYIEMPRGDRAYFDDMKITKFAESFEAEFDYYAINKNDRILYDGRYNGKNHKQLIDIGNDKGMMLNDINPIQTKIFSILYDEVEMGDNLWDLEAYLNQFSVRELNNLFIKEFDYDIYTGNNTKPQIIKGIIMGVEGEPENMVGDELIAWIEENDMEDEEITVYPDEGGAGVIYLDEDDDEKLNIYNAESFEAQTKLTDYTRGKDWEGKPYTGQIFPDHPDLDPELADRNKDGKMASWERAIGNQVAKGKSRFKAPRKMTKTTTKFTQRKPITAASSLLPYAIAVGALATILGLRGKE